MTAMTKSYSAILLTISALIFSFTLVAHPLARTVLVTGSAQGHGLAFVNDYAERGWTVIATTRTPSTADRLQALAVKFPNVVIEELDVTDFAEVDALAEKYAGTPIDVLNLNGAINTFRVGLNRFGKTDYAWLDQVLRTNVIGQLYVAEAFLEHIASSEQKTIAVMSAVGGSITNVRSATAPSYRASKAGLNMLMRTYGEAVKDRGVIVAVIAPGTIDTENYMAVEDPSTLSERDQRMISANAYAPRHAIGAMIDLIDGLTLDDISTFHKWDGTTLPW
jgi:NAD(P)-dependent dehydrogenase (short-subunit alcohol dehydrogenase family)